VPRKCPQCGGDVAPDARFCTACGSQLGLQAEIVLEVETGRCHVQNHACQLRFRVTNAAPAAGDVVLRMELHGRGRLVEQEDDEIEQYCRFQDRGDHFIFSFPFRPLIPGEFPVETLRMIVSPADCPEESRVWELPDRSLFVHAADPDRQAAAHGVHIEGGINIEFTRLEEMYGSDIRNLLNLHVEEQASAETGQPEWQPILLRLAGNVKRTRCGFAGCRRPLAVAGSFRCGRCEAAMCRRHQDDEKTAYCKVCAEAVRAEEFEKLAQRLPLQLAGSSAVEALCRVTQPASAFRGRVWTEPGTQPTTRDLFTVARNSKGCYRIGDRFTLNVQTERDCYLTLLDIGTSGRVSLLLDNYRLRAGTPVALSGPDREHAWIIGGPPGVERIKALFTTLPQPLFPGSDPFSPLDPDADALLARVNSVAVTLEQTPSGSWTDAMCEFAVEEA